MYSNGYSRPEEYSKEFESFAFQTLKIAQLRTDDDHYNVSDKKNNLKNNKVSPTVIKVKEKRREPTTQLESFQNAMKLLVIFGQCIGLNPVQGILDLDVSKIRFKFCSWRLLYCAIVGVGQSMAVTLCFYRLFKNSLSIGALGYISFYGTTCAATFQFIQIGYKWPQLMNNISKCNLDEYIDTKIKNKCYIATVIFISLGFVEHVLSMIFRIEHILSCQQDASFYEELLSNQFPWYFDLNFSFNIRVPVGIYLQVINLITTMTWNYLDLYIVCISMYLTSMLNKINAQIIAASEEYSTPTSHWRALREDYNRGTRLIRSFDDVISGLVFTSFASNLFFICLQVFNILAHGLISQNKKHICQNQFYNGIFGGYEYTVYIVFSTIYLLARALVVSLVAAGINTASLVPAPALYNVPSSAFCDEVSRFITQVNEDKIALSGLQFFHVTRDLVLTVAGTIVTYELVLLQFSSDEIGNTNTKE